MSQESSVVCLNRNFEIAEGAVQKLSASGLRVGHCEWTAGPSEITKHAQTA
jgi:hypothetical protein